VATEEPSCRQLSEDHLEPLTGSAAHAPAWLLVEHPGPWGPAAPKDVGWSDGSGAELIARTEQLGIRLGLIRRPERRAAAARQGTTTLLVHTGPDRPWVRLADTADPAELLQLDLDGLAEGRAPALPAPEGQVLAVCTHGSRDVCCARAGRPVAAGLAERFGDAVWETSHVGGHRFAANLVCFPHGLMYGRADVASAVEIAEDYRRGRITPGHYRGRTCWPGPVQAAEQWLRNSLGLVELDAVRVVGYTAGAPTEVDLVAAGGDGQTRHRLRVETLQAGPARPFSCGAAKLEMPPVYRVTTRDSPTGPAG
jgi:hypothetical protein